MQYLTAKGNLIKVVFQASIYGIIILLKYFLDNTLDILQKATLAVLTAFDFINYTVDGLLGVSTWSSDTGHLLCLGNTGNMVIFDFFRMDS